MRKYEYSDDDRQYLQMMQENIARMASNSANCKTWTVTIVAALLTIGCGIEALNGWLLLAFIPIIAFGYLDVFYLHIERGMRNRQRDFLDKNKVTLSLDAIVNNHENQSLIKDYNDALYKFSPLSSEGEPESQDKASTTDGWRSKSILPFYGGLSICVFIVLIILNWQFVISLFS